MEVQLTTDQKAFVRRAVESGRLRSEEEAVKEAHALWEGRERQRLEFRAECFNVGNHPLWGFPGTTVGTSTFGVISSTIIDSREFQGALKYTF